MYMDEQQRIDQRMMGRCLWLARQGRLLSRPNPMVGAVIVAGDGRILGEGYHARCGEGHAEVNAFASVKATDEALLPHATIYVSLEPCAHWGKTPPCAELIVSKGVRRCVVGTVDPFAQVQGRGIARLREAGVEVTVGVREQECQWLNRRFFTYHKEGRPYILLKWAQSQDGFLDDHGQAVALSSKSTQQWVHRLRSHEDAIVVGRTTWQREHPRLDTRLWGGRPPRRFVLGHGADVPPDLAVENVEALLARCRDEQLQSLIVEGGGQTLRSFLDKGLWDEIRVETAPVATQGGTEAPTLPAEARLGELSVCDGRHIRTYVRPRTADE